MAEYIYHGYKTVELMHECCSQHPCTGATITEIDGKQAGKIIRNGAYKNTEMAKKVKSLYLEIAYEVTNKSHLPSTPQQTLCEFGYW